MNSSILQYYPKMLRRTDPCIFLCYLQSFRLFFCNLMGMIPFSFTVTSHIVVTLGLATLAFLVSMLSVLKRTGSI